jgi:hypothetical protein
MSLRKDTPCDLDGICPYESGEYCSCEYWCGADEPQDDPYIWDCDPADCPEAEDDFWIRSTEQPKDATL